jgi:arabinose-5-phosphate isomerase
MVSVQDCSRTQPAAEQLSYARRVIRAEAAALRLAARRLDGTFLQVVELIQRCAGRVAVTGTGKSADVGQKIAGTLNSTGTRAYFLDATKAMHGDLGMVHPNDIVLVLSHSGESEEIVRLLPSLRQLAAALVAITGNSLSTLARQSDAAIIYGPLEEVCPLGLAPSSSTTVMIAVGDALAFVLSRLRDFSHEDFARYHPAGSLGRKLLKVDVLMRCGDELRIAFENETVRQALARLQRRGRGVGAIMVTDATERLSGIFTDSDLVRLLEQNRDEALDGPIRDVMTPSPFQVALGTRVADAVELLHRHKISELPVVGADGQPVGLLDITDLIGLVPEEEAAPQARAA